MPCPISGTHRPLITPHSPLLSPAPTKPRLTHTLHHQQKSSVLSLAADARHIFSGSQTADIYVWDRVTFQVKTTLHGHTGSVLALELALEKEWLFSSSGDSTVRIWSTRSLTPLYIITPNLDTSSGDIFSLTFAPSLRTLYFGCQNTSLQWYDFSRTKAKASDHSPDRGTEVLEFDGDTGLTTSLDLKKWHRFFDNTPRLGRAVVAPSVATSSAPTTPSGGSTPALPRPRVLQVSSQNIIHSAHYGYIYCMALLPSPLEGATERKTERGDERLLATGSGDETVKIWHCTHTGPSLAHTFAVNQGGVLSLVARDETLYAGCQDGCVAVWDLETRSLVRLILAQENSDVLSLSMIDTDLYTCSANGWVQRWSAQYACTASWHAHAGIVLSSIITNTCASSLMPKAKTTDARAGWCLVTGANDNDVKVWDIDSPRGHVSAEEWAFGEGASSHDPLLQTLSTFVSIPSVSNSEKNREDCRQAAIWLKRCLGGLGADATMIATGEGVNPLVLATFKGVPSGVPKPRVLFYGHYDVISAPGPSWKTPPFTLTGLNGYLYGRGVTDNKGPILAVAFAASGLLRRRALACDVVILIEGEEEAGSGGFAEAVRRHKDLIGHVDVILVSNSYWIGEDTPCITYGLRGVVHVTIDVSSTSPDLHSGVEGGSVTEPMVDMVKLLARLSEGSKVLVPGFYDQVRPEIASERELYQLLAGITHKPASSLSSRWREPSLSVHCIETSGPGNATVIPARVKAKVSIRIVPDQDLDLVAKSLVDHVRTSFHELQSPNTLEVSIDRTADWWLGDLEGRYFKALEGAVEAEWNIRPLRIREGGSIPSVPFLEKEFGCPAHHLPMGQSSDQAHLPNERIRLINLRKGMSVVERFFLAVSQLDSGVSME